MLQHPEFWGSALCLAMAFLNERHRHIMQADKFWSWCSTLRVEQMFSESYRPIFQFFSFELITYTKKCEEWQVHKWRVPKRATAWYLMQIICIFPPNQLWNIEHGVYHVQCRPQCFWCFFFFLSPLPSLPTKIRVMSECQFTIAITNFALFLINKKAVFLHVWVLTCEVFDQVVHPPVWP